MKKTLIALAVAGAALLSVGCASNEPTISLAEKCEATNYAGKSCANFDPAKQPLTLEEKLAKCEAGDLHTRVCINLKAQ
ncbi:hypothetical protein [Amphritea sp. HPY]|uniref:hypothetical protein n=1 Tax=Amphritea sp. HPY TaxID=3421652 RepID=UPI003D7C7B00